MNLAQVIGSPQELSSKIQSLPLSGAAAVQTRIQMSALSMSDNARSLSAHNSLVVAADATYIRKFEVLGGNDSRRSLIPMGTEREIMMDFEDFGYPMMGKPLSPTDKAAAILLAMGKSAAGKLLKFFTHAELRLVIKSAQNLRPVPPDELSQIVAEFEDLFAEGAGLMDNAKAMESILDEGFRPDEVDRLLGRRAAFQATETSAWDSIQSIDPQVIGKILLREHPQTLAYILSMLPPSYGAKVLIVIPDEQRADIMNRAVHMKEIVPAATQIIEKRVATLIAELDLERNSAGSAKVAALMNELDKPQVDSLLSSLETLSKDSANKIRPKLFLFEDFLSMPQGSRVTLLNDVPSDIITTALRGSTNEIKECVLSSISPRQRRLVESELAVPMVALNLRDLAIARRTIAKEAIRLADSGKIRLAEDRSSAA